MLTLNGVLINSKHADRIITSFDKSNFLSSKNKIRNVKKILKKAHNNFALSQLSQVKGINKTNIPWP